MDKQNLDEIVARNAFARYIGLELLEVSEGYAAGRIKLEKHHMNIYDGMHGGCVFALADTVAGVAASTCGKYVTTINGSMNYLRPVADTEYVICEATAVRQGNRLAVLDVVVENDNQDILSNGTFTYYCMKHPIGMDRTDTVMKI